MGKNITLINSEA